MSSNKSIKIYIIVPSLNIGGTEKHILNVFSKLSKEIYNIKIFTLTEKGKLASEFEKNDLDIICFNKSFDWSNSSKFIKFFIIINFIIRYLLYLYKFKPDIIHYFLPSAYWIAGTTSLFSPVKNFIMSRRSLNNYQNKFFCVKYLERFLHRKMDFLIANSNAVKKELLLETNNHNKVRLIYNGINKINNITKDEISLLKKKYEFNNEDFIICNVANLIPYKGHLYLIRALKEIEFKLPKNWKLIIIGENRNNYKKNILEWIDKYNLKKKIFIFESIKNINEILLISNLYVSSSLEEGFSNSIIESMAAGLPSVVTNVGGSSEAVRNNIDGLVVKSNDFVDLSKAIKKLSNDIDLQKKMGIAAKKRVIHEFNIEKTIESYENIYNDIISL